MIISLPRDQSSLLELGHAFGCSELGCVEYTTRSDTTYEIRVDNSNCVKCKHCGAIEASPKVVNLRSADEAANVLMSCLKEGGVFWETDT